MFWNDIKKLNFANDNNSYWLGWVIYIFMINEHNISVKFGSDSFTATCDIDIKTCFSKGEIFMNWNVWNEWYNNNKKKDKQQVE
jgi:hypothetical protein